MCERERQRQRGCWGRAGERIEIWETELEKREEGQELSRTMKASDKETSERDEKIKERNEQRKNESCQQ